jgi:chromosome segregation ATPase
MRTLVIDEKYSVDYDPDNNDMPTHFLRHGDGWKTWDEIAQHSNVTLAMFYALLRYQVSVEQLTAENEGLRATVVQLGENAATAAKEYAGRIEALEAQRDQLQQDKTDLRLELARAEGRLRDYKQAIQQLTAENEALWLTLLEVEKELQSMVDTKAVDWNAIHRLTMQVRQELKRTES